MSNEIKNIRFANYTVDLGLRQLRRGQDVLPVSGKAFDLLAYMASNPGRPLLKAELLSEIWPNSFVEEANLSQNVFLLRKILGSGPDSPIVTLPGRGYQFAATVTIVDSTSHSGQAPPPGPLALEATQTRVLVEEETEEHIAPWQSPWVVSLAGAGLVLLAAAGWLGWQRWEDRVGGPPVQLVVADLDGGTGDQVLDRTITTITRSELAQSPFVYLLPQSTVRSTLQQMMHSPTDAVTVPLAREACERTGSQAVLHETIARAGSGFLLTEEATNCVDGASLGLTHQQVAGPEDLSRAITKATGVVRHALGESRRTIVRFSAPLSSANTQSIEALKAYSQSAFLAQGGHFAEAIELDKQAIAIDPGFAAAYLDLSGDYLATLDPDDARGPLQKAYDLRASANQLAQLYIAARYHTYITGDLYEAARNYRAWIALYPRQVQPWSGIDNVYRQLGDNSNALDAAQHTMQLAPSNQAAYQALIDAQMRVGDFAAARKTSDAALARHFDTESIHYLRLRLGHLQHDSTFIAEEEAWGRQHPDSPIFLGNQVVFALQAGRVKEAHAFLDAMSAAFAKQGSPAAGLRLAQLTADAMAQLGDVDQARKQLHLAPPQTDVNYLLALVDTGDAATAAKMLQDQLAAQPRNTLWNVHYKRLIDGDIALTQGRSAEALAALDATHDFDAADAETRYLRGLAFLQAKRFTEAETQFQELLAHPEIDPADVAIDIAQLQLARTFALEGHHADAVAAYRLFLAQWSNADPDQPLLLQARQELTRL
jgi:DNA-binding winged helix-turn-helix (wHTH) protein/tetratricopeptide (TPR) repeat protein